MWRARAAAAAEASPPLWLLLPQPLLAMAALMARRRASRRAEAATAGLVRGATAGWTRQLHWLHHAGVREAVHTVLLLAERLWTRRLALGALPGLPAEMWLHALTFARRGDWPAAVC